MKNSHNNFEVYQIINHDFFALKILANVNIEALKFVVRLFMRLTILNAISFNLFPQNINSNSTIFDFGGKIIIWMRDDRVKTYVLEKRLKLMAFEMVSRKNRHTPASKLRN